MNDENEDERRLSPVKQAVKQGTLVFISSFDSKPPPYFSQENIMNSRFPRHLCERFAATA